MAGLRPGASFGARAMTSCEASGAPPRLVLERFVMLARLVALPRRLLAAADLLAAAGRVAGAVEGGWPPRGRDLDRLGVDPAQFATIRRA